MDSERSFASAADYAVVPYSYDSTARLEFCDEWNRCASLTVPTRGASGFVWGCMFGAATVATVVLVARR